MRSVYPSLYATDIAQAIRRTCVVTACIVLPASCIFSPPCDARDIPHAYVTVANAHRVPPAVLYAVGLTESRRTTPHGVRPWPWTLNVDGRAYYYPSRSEAWLALRRHVAAKRTVDVGLMQVNWNWHSKLLKDTWRALEPYHNLDAAARLLRGHYDATGDWWTAIGRYHAPANERRAARYRLRVSKHLEDLAHVAAR